MFSGRSVRGPRWFWIPLRVLLVTFLLTLLSFAVSLLLGILSTITLALLRGAHPNMTHAYREIALPVAIAVAGTSVVVLTVIEVRRYQQSKTLERIEKAM